MSMSPGNHRKGTGGKTGVPMNVIVYSLSELNGVHREEAKESLKRVSVAVKDDPVARKWLRDHLYLWTQTP